MRTCDTCDTAPQPEALHRPSLFPLEGYCGTASVAEPSAVTLVTLVALPTGLWHCPQALHRPGLHLGCDTCDTAHRAFIALDFFQGKVSAAWQFHWLNTLAAVTPVTPVTLLASSQEHVCAAWQLQWPNPHL